MARMTRKEHEHRGRIDYVLDVTEELFSRKGYSGTSMKEIAKRAEFALATLYRLFKSKRDIYAALLEKRFSQLADRLGRESPSEGDVVARIEAFIEAKMTYLYEHWDFAKIYFAHRWSGADQSASPAAESALEIYSGAINGLVRDIRRGIRQGRIRKASAERLAAAVDGITSELVNRWLTVGRPNSPSKDIEQAKGMILKGIATEAPEER